MSRDWRVLGDDIVPEGTSYVCTVKILWPRLSESTVQIDPPFDDHTTEVVQKALYLISLATPPVWISQIMMAILEAQAMERPSGE